MAAKGRTKSKPASSPAGGPAAGTSPQAAGAGTAGAGAGTAGVPLGEALGDVPLEDAALVDALAGYRRRVAGSYRALPPEEIDQLPPGRMWLSPKLDGELWFLVSRAGGVVLTSTRGRAITGALPVLAQAGALPAGTIVAGELYARVEGRRPRVGDLAAAMAGGKRARVQDICFGAFDLVEDAGVPPAGPYETRHARLEALLKPSANVGVIPVEPVNTAAQVRARFDAEVATGEAEGLIVRLESGLTYKLKPSITIDAAVIAYTVKADAPTLLRSLLLGLVHADGRVQIFGGCGQVGSDDARRELAARLAPLKAASAVRWASESGSLYTFVTPGLAAEVRVSDLQAERSDGSVSLTPLISHGAAGWTAHGLRPCPRPIHPVLERLRSDKQADAEGAGFGQVAPYLPRDTGAAAEPAARPTSAVVRREVWTKETKGQVAVRKLLVWKTNKEAVDPAFPAYVVHWTDYSAGRGSPLEREVRLALDEDEARRIADALVEENIVKGWSKAEA